VGFLFKSGDELYDLGIDLIGRKDYDEAREKFFAAIEKGVSKEKSELAGIYIALINVGKARGDVNVYDQLRGKCATCSVQSLKFGLTDVDMGALAEECRISANEIRATSMPEQDYMAKGKALQASAAEYASFGDQPLKISEIFSGSTKATGSREALILQAMAFEVMGRGVVYADPKKASEYLQMAYNFRRQIGDSGEEDLNLMKKYAKSAKCWICGRPANGEGIHFMALRSNISQAFRTSTEKDIVKPASDDFGSIYICIPCYTAISNRSDEISRKYYNQAMTEMQAMEARLTAQINAVRVTATIR